ncbi:Hypothetical predicted protein [Paramuricea clavata]|uniref:Uncharacterized protein n=1 Tax=Paramuricea clavata TaxID=317549 RepID=A0A7D9JUX5_PARCT|nr:Hypothetical predicted protein [Paramuricea clavata]
MTEVNSEFVPGTKPLDPSKKVKDPRRVEAGKRLAKISQQAKAAKKARAEENLKTEVRESWMKENDGGGWISVERLCMIFGLGIGLGSLYLTWQSREKNPVKQVNEIVNDDDVKKDSSKNPPEDSLKEPFDDLFD